MKKLVTVLSLMLMSSTVFAASDDCARRFNSLMGRQYEMSRIETSALNRLIKGDRKISDSLYEEAEQQKLEIEERKATFLEECLK
jgi:hypothetical protein